MDSQFRLELANASTCRDELGALRRGQAAIKSAVDLVLPAPAVHRLVADTQVAGDVLDAASGRDEVQNPLTKLRGVTAFSHAVLQCLGGTAAWWIPIIRLQEIQGALILGSSPGDDLLRPRSLFIRTAAGEFCPIRQSKSMSRECHGHTLRATSGCCRNAQQISKGDSRAKSGSDDERFD